MVRDDRECRGDDARVCIVPAKSCERECVNFPCKGQTCGGVSLADTLAKPPATSVRRRNAGGRQADVGVRGYACRAFAHARLLDI